MCLGPDDQLMWAKGYPHDVIRYQQVPEDLAFAQNNPENWPSFRRIGNWLNSEDRKLFGILFEDEVGSINEAGWLLLQNMKEEDMRRAAAASEATLLKN